MRSFKELECGCLVDEYAQIPCGKDECIYDEYMAKKHHLTNKDLFLELVSEFLGSKRAAKGLYDYLKKHGFYLDGEDDYEDKDTLCDMVRPL